MQGVDLDAGFDRISQIICVRHVKSSIVQSQMIVDCGSDRVVFRCSESSESILLCKSHVRLDIDPIVPVTEFQQNGTLLCCFRCSKYAIIEEQTTVRATQALIHKTKSHLLHQIGV